IIPTHEQTTFLIVHLALIRAGYETDQDLDTSNAEKLTNDLSIPLSSSQAIFSQRKPQTRAIPL
ncbi:hypothetical protein B0H13DRAFT_1993028, partial [Mycena leptocephala]